MIYWKPTKMNVSNQVLFEAAMRHDIKNIVWS